MIARVTTVQGQPEEIAERVQFFEEVRVPSRLGVAGFKAAYFLVVVYGPCWLDRHALVRRVPRVTSTSMSTTSSKSG